MVLELEREGEYGTLPLLGLWEEGRPEEMMNSRFRRFCWLFRGFIGGRRMVPDRGMVGGWLLGQFFSQGGKRRGPAGGSGLRRDLRRFFQQIWG